MRAGDRDGEVPAASVAGVPRMMRAVVLDLEVAGFKPGEASLNFFSQVHQAGMVLRKGFTLTWAKTPALT